MAQSLPPGVDLNKVPIQAPPPGTVSNFVNPPSFAPAVAGVSIVIIVLEVFVVAARLYTNSQSRRKIWLDDCKTLHDGSGSCSGL